jgi:Pyruvate/2-oxoacid:ferredoxin oxidoreductase delta subunit
LNIELVEFDNPRVLTPPQGSAFKNIEIASQVLDADVVINLPKLKTHSQMLLTLGVKNLFGTVVGKRKGEWHFMAGVDRDIFASLLLDICFLANPALTLLDGIWGMEGHGPSNGDLRPVGLIAAGDDTVALDTALCHVLGASLSSFAFVRVAQKRGLGETDLKNISFAGKTLSEVAVPDFKVPHLDSVTFLPGFLNRLARRALVSKPIHVSSNCSECRQCEEVCPADAIAVNDGRGKIDYDRCIRCFCCQEVCPENAIRFHQGLLLKLSNIFDQLVHR